MSTSWSERAPNYQERYASGPHLETGVFEVGDSGLPVEQALGLDFSLRKRMGFVTGSITPLPPPEPPPTSGLRWEGSGRDENKILSNNKICNIHNFM